MVKKKSGYLQYIVEDVLGHIDGITHRAMFGGYGIYQFGVIFAIIADDQLYFKVGPSNQSDYEDSESAPFTYEKGNGKQAVMSYWLVPEDVQNDSDEIATWLQKAIDVSLCSKKKSS